MVRSDVPAASFTLSGLLSRLAAWSTLVVAVMYAVGRLLAEVYYREFGIGATSAGLSSADLVGQAAGSAIWLVILAAPGIALAGTSKATRRKLFMTDDMTNLGRKTFGALFVVAFIVIGIPVGAVIWLGEIDRAGDYGIPVAALGLGLVLYTAKARAGARAEDMVDGAAANNRVDDTPIAEGHADSRAAPQGGRTVSIPERNPDLPLSRQAVAEGRREFLWFIAYYAIVGIVGVAIGVVGVLQQAGAVRAGHAEQPPPWSLAPGLAAVEVYVREPTRMPVGDCLIEIGRSGSVWVFWDPNKERLWRTNESVQLVDC